MSRQRKPTHLKLIAGTHRTARANPHEPQPPFAVPDPPPYLAADERAAWDRFAASLADLRISSAADFAAVETLACDYALAQRLRAVIRAEGATYETTTTQGCVMVRPRPEVALLNKADALVLALLARFGLTPADRSRVAAGPPLGRRDQDAEFT